MVQAKVPQMVIEKADRLLFVSRTVLIPTEFTESCNVTPEEVNNTVRKKEDAFCGQCSESSSSVSFKRKLALMASLRRSSGSVPNRT